MSSAETDRELLEWAAKAVGASPDPNIDQTPTGLYFQVDGDEIYEVYTNGDWGFWNPLTNDGDALRLLVSLKIDLVSNARLMAKVEAFNHFRVEGSCIENYEDDPCAATRRAIVRAAAEIGKGMK